MKVCNKCDVLKELTDFEKQSPTTYRKTCKKCRNTFCYLRKIETGAYERRKVKQKLSRKDPNNFAKFVVHDAKEYDRQHSFESDLTIDAVRALVSKGCAYCGQSAGRIGIDRIDNTKGHMMDNINPCCTRCNFMRRNMPYEAWLLMAPAMREAREKGLFQDWQGGFRHHYK